MHLGASGKVLAAYLEPAERERLLAAPDDDALAASARADPRPRLGDHQRRARRRGRARVAAPVLDARGRLLAGLSLAGPTERMRAAGLDAMVTAVRAAAAQIEARI